MAAFFALGEPCGLLADVRMAIDRRVERLGSTRALGVAQACRLGKKLLGVLPKRCDGLSKRKELVFRVAHQFHEDVALPAALAAKAPHSVCQRPVQAVGVARELCGPAGALPCHVFNQLEGFF